MTAAPTLSVQGLVKRFGGVLATDDLWLDVTPGELHALIGPNGAGKTTAVNQITGELAPDAGRILFDGADITRRSVHARTRAGLGRTFQITQLMGQASARENVMLALIAARRRSWRLFGRAFADGTLRHEADVALKRVGLAEAADRNADALSQGQRKQLDLAMALVASPRLLLLDEPMAGLGAGETAAMVQTLQALKGSCAILLIEHDMDAVFALADRVTVLVGGRAIASGSVEQVRADPDVRSAYLGQDDVPAHGGETA
jgi:branched-chain amino acid transport system ATP-binding protein